jgi:hypothetical protein
MDKSTIFEINGEKYDVVKRGIAQARQVSSATRWLARYGTPAFRKLSEGNFESMGGFDVVLAVLGSLDENGLVELFEAVFGCSKEVAEQDFDIALLVNGLVALYNNAPALRGLADRFFSPASSENTEGSNSTQSDPPTDG